MSRKTEDRFDIGGSSPPRVSAGLAGAWTTGASRRALAVAGAIAAIVYLAGLTGRWWPTVDSAAYLGLARSIAAGEGYRFNGAAHATFPPGLPLLLAAVRMLFGPGFWAPNALMVLCGLGALAMMYLTMRRLAGGVTAWWTCLLTAFSYTFYLNAHRILSEMPFALVFWGLFYSLVRYLRGGGWWLAAAAALSAAAILIRAPGLLLIGPLALGLALTDWRSRGLAISDSRPRTGDSEEGPAGRAIRNSCLPAGTGRSEIRNSSASRNGPRPASAWIAAGLILVIAALVTVVLYRAAVSHLNATPQYIRLVTPRAGHVGRALVRRLTGALTTAPEAVSESFLGSEFYPAGLLLAALMIVGIARLARRRQWLAPAMLILYPAGLALSLGRHGMHARYFLQVLPLMAYAALVGLGWCLDKVAALLDRPGTKHLPASGLAAFAILLLAVNAPKLARNAFYYSFLSHGPAYYRAIQHGQYVGTFAAADLLRHHCPSRSRVATDDEPEVLHVLAEQVVRQLPNWPLSNSAGPARPDWTLDDVGPFDFVLLCRTAVDSRAGRLAAVLAGDPRWRLAAGGGGLQPPNTTIDAPSVLLYQQVKPTTSGHGSLGR